MADRPCVGGGSEFPRACRLRGQQPAELAEAVGDRPGLGADAGARDQAASSARVTTWGASSSRSVGLGPSERGIVSVMFLGKVSGTDTGASPMTPNLLGAAPNLNSLVYVSNLDTIFIY